MIPFDVLNEPRWQADIEDKQSRFQLDRNQPFAFQNGNMVYNPRDQEWIPNTTDNPRAKCPGKNPEHEHHVIHTLAWSLQLINITLSFDVKSKNIYYGKTRIKCDLEHGYCSLNHAFNATVIREPINHCRIFDVSRSHARMINFQQRYFIETFADNGANSGHQHNEQMCDSLFQNQLYNESALSRFEVLTKTIYKCNEDCPYYAGQYQDFFVQYYEGFFSLQVKHQKKIRIYTHNRPNKIHSITPYIEADIGIEYVILQESPVYLKSEIFELIRKKTGLVQYSQMYRSTLNSTI